MMKLVNHIKLNRVRGITKIIFGLCWIIQTACANNHQTLRITTNKDEQEKQQLAKNYAIASGINLDSVKIIQQQEKNPMKMLEKGDIIFELFVTAQNQLQFGQLDEAEKTALEGLKLLESTEFIKLLSKIYNQQGNLTKADSCLEIVRKRNIQQPTE